MPESASQQHRSTETSWRQESNWQRIRSASANYALQCARVHQQSFAAKPVHVSPLYEKHFIHKRLWNDAKPFTTGVCMNHVDTWHARGGLSTHVLNAHFQSRCVWVCVVYSSRSTALNNSDKWLILCLNLSSQLFHLVHGYCSLIL